MATLHPITYEKWRKSNGSYPIAFRLVHNRETTTFNSGLYARSDQLLSDLAIKDSKLKQEVNRKQIAYEQILLNNCSLIEQMPVRNVVSLLKRQNQPKTPPPSCLAFIKLAETEGLISKSRLSIYRALAKHLQAFFRNDYFVFAEITPKVVADFQKYLQGLDISYNAQQTYLSSFRSLYNKAKEHYNDYENNVIRISGEPFRGIKVGAPAPSRETRYISLTKLRILLNTPLPPMPRGGQKEYGQQECESGSCSQWEQEECGRRGVEASGHRGVEGKTTNVSLYSFVVRPQSPLSPVPRSRLADCPQIVGSRIACSRNITESIFPRNACSRINSFQNVNSSRNPILPRIELAKDVFTLSFGLIGMNAVDMYELKRGQYDGEKITYCRSKVASKRADGGRFCVAVLPYVAQLIDKYADSESEYLFDFHKRYCTVEDFRRAVNKGLEQLRALAGIQGKITHYTARHTWASIAYNDLDADESLIASALNHAKPRSVTDFYTNKERKINELNKKVAEIVGFI